jgi:nucleotide-binding universal stress UspA family protein
MKIKIKKILIIADESDSAAKAIQYGFGLAAKLKANVLILSIIEPSQVLGNPDAGVFPDDALIDKKAKAEDFLNKLKKHPSAENLETSVVVGDTLKTTIETAKKWKADLVVTCTHNQSGLSKLFSGDITESIIAHSPAPVLIIPIDK